MRILCFLVAMSGVGSAYAVDGNPFVGFRKAPAAIPLPDGASKGGASDAARSTEKRYMDLSRARRIGNINGREVWFDEMTQAYVNPTEEDVRHAASITVAPHDAGPTPDAPGFDPANLPQIPLPFNRPTGPAGTAAAAKSNIPPTTGAKSPK